MTSQPSETNSLPPIPRESQAPEQITSVREKSAVVDDQPRPSRPMMVNPAGDGGGDRNALRVPVMADGLRSWSYPLFDCFSDLPTCVLSTFCCCYVYSQNKLRFAHLQSYGAPLRERAGVYNHECIAHVLLQCLNAGWALQAISRSDVRRRYGIRGDACNDVLSSACCVPCELVQEHREIQLEESSLYPL